MKYITRAIAFASLWVAFFSLPVLQTGCFTAPSQRVQTVTTLKIVGDTAKVAIDSAAQLLAHGHITVQQWQKVATIYDSQFQPAYAVAVNAAHSDLSSVASPDLVALAAQITDAVSQLTAK